MAIKGKSRRRSRTHRGAAPRPQIPQRTLSPLQHPLLRRAIVAVLSLAAVLGGLRIWENVSRSRALERYVRKLIRAEEPLSNALNTQSAASLDKTSRDFTQARITVKQFLDQTSQWERDFRLVKDKVQLLKPPAEVKDAQDDIVQAVDMYVGVVRLYNLAAQTRQVADAEGATGQRQVEDKVQVIVQHASEWISRAEAVMGLGTAKLAAYEEAWHVKGPVIGPANASQPSPS